jgi:hypothetical protein
MYVWINFAISARKAFAYTFGTAKGIRMRNACSRMSVTGKHYRVQTVPGMAY